MKNNKINFFLLNFSFDIIMIGILLILSLGIDTSNNTNNFLSLTIFGFLYPTLSFFIYRKKIKNNFKLFYSIYIFTIITTIFMFLTVLSLDIFFTITIILLIGLNVVRRYFLRTVEFEVTNNTEKYYELNKFLNQVIFVLILMIGIIVGYFTKAVILNLIITTALTGILLFRYVYKKVLVVNKDLFLYGTITSLSSYLIVSTLLLENYFKMITIIPIIITFWLIDKTLKLF